MTFKIGLWRLVPTGMACTKFAPAWNAGDAARRLACALAVAIGLTASASAQVTGTVSGVVKDPQGGVMPGVTAVLTNEARGTQSSPAITNGEGEFVFPNVAAGTYTLEVSMPSFKTMKRTGIDVSAGTRTTLGALTIEVGGASETVTVTGEAPIIQAESGERSFTIPTTSVENLPIANRSFTALTSLAPGVSGNNRIGGGGGNNIMVDGVSAVDTGSNSILLQINVESIAEVKVLTSGYQAEYGRSSGLQVTAVTKSGSNRFHGSLYDVERNSDWYSNNKENILNGDPKPKLKQRDIGYSLGGPIGKPGGKNKLFFFYSHEYAPRTQGGDTIRFRVPTALERAGDFSQTYDNNGSLFTAIRDPQTGQNFPNSRIPTERFYQPGLAILNLYPLPNINGTGLAYNYETTQPVEKALAYQPAVRLDFQPTSSLRITAKYSGWNQTTTSFQGTLADITASEQYKPHVFTAAFTANYTVKPTMFLEATVGHSLNVLTGCGLAQGGTGPTYCTSGVPTGALANRNDAGLGGLPRIFPDDPALVLNPDYFAYDVLSELQPAFFQNGMLLRTPNFTWGGRVANSPPNVPFAGFLNSNSTYDVSISLTKVAGRHTVKGGFYNTHSWKAQQQNSGATFGTYNFQNNTANPLDTGFPFANALLGVVNSFNQQSTYIEGTYVYNNTEAYLQDNWKLNSRLTLDYGVRFVHQQPQYDSLRQSSNFLPATFDPSQVPTLYAAACSNGAATCTGTTRVAKDPRNGTLLGAGSSASIGTIVPGTGNPVNGIHCPAGSPTAAAANCPEDIASTTYTWRALGYNPRAGAAYDLRGDQKMVVRGGLGLYFDRPDGNSIYAQVLNPPSTKNVTVSSAFLTGNLTGAQAPPALSVFEYAGGLPKSLQWNTGIQLTLPWSSALDVSYVGQHAWDQYTGVNINAVDFGTAFLPQYQDSTQAVTSLGSNIVANNQMRAFLGYANITQQLSYNHNTYHSLQTSFQRRFKNGVSFGFNDTWNISNTGSTGARLQHNPDGTYQLRDDQALADRLLFAKPVRHNLKGNFVWDLPDLKASGGMHVLGALVNDWQLSGIWTASTGAPYTVGFAYNTNGASTNLTGSPDYGARIRIVGDTGNGCSADLYNQFNTAAFAGPRPNSDGLESGANYLKGCFQQVLDLSLARTIRLSGAKAIQLRVDMFNAPNLAIITGRNTTLQLNDLADPVTNRSPVFDPTTGLLNDGTNLTASGAVSTDRSRPRNAGFGVANTFQQERRIQAQIRFSF